MDFSGDRKKIYIVMPAYNAEANIISVFDRIPEAVFPKIAQFIVVNDGSIDSTYQRINELRQRFPSIYCINKKENEGYARAQKTVFSR